MKTIKLSIVFFCISLISYGQFGKIKDIISGEQSINFTEEQAVEAIKTTLENGITKEVEQLSLENGFYENNLVKIGFPEDLKKVERKLRALGFNSIVEKAVLSLNRTAEEATKEAIPIFTDAITNISINDGITIIKGEDNAATSYLENRTYEQLYQKMLPIVYTKFSEVKADIIWTELTSKYNSLPFTKDVNPDLIEYVTQAALSGIFKSIAKEELEIRKQVDARTSDILKKVFGNN